MSNYDQYRASGDSEDNQSQTYRTGDKVIGPEKESHLLNSVAKTSKSGKNRDKSNSEQKFGLNRRSKAKSKKSHYDQAMTSTGQVSPHNSQEYTANEKIGFGDQDSDPEREIEELERNINKRNTLHRQSNEFQQHSDPPIELITVKERPSGRHQFKCNPEAINKLMEIDTPVAVFSMVGQHGCGKSYLLNRLLDLSGDSSFKVAQQVNSIAEERSQQGTQGVWMLGTPLNLVDRGDVHILILDFAGFQTQKSNTMNSIDDKLFLLSTIISSTIAFNMQKDFNAKNLEQLQMVKSLHRLLSFRPSDLANASMRETYRQTDGGDAMKDQLQQEHLFPQLMPKLLFLVRDQQINFVDKNNQEMSKQEYMEQQLSQASFKSNARIIGTIRDKLLKTFPERDLFALTHPLGREASGDPGNLMEMPDNSLDTQFIQEVNDLMESILKDTAVKQIWSRQITGRSLALLLNECIQELNKESGNGIQFSQAWDRLLERELDHIYNECLDEISEYISQNIRFGPEDSDDERINDEQEIADSDRAGNSPQQLVNRTELLEQFDILRRQVMGKFDRILKMAATRNERGVIARKMEEVENFLEEQQSQHEQKNKKLTQQQLEKMHDKAIKKVRDALQNKQSLKRIDFRDEIKSYLSTMEDTSWQYFSDTDCMTFILRQLPSNLQRVNNKLAKCYEMPDSHDEKLIKAKEQGAEIQAKIEEEQQKQHEQVTLIQALRQKKKAAQKRIDQLNKEKQALEEKQKLLKQDETQKEEDLRDEIQRHEEAKARRQGLENRERKIEQREKEAYIQRQKNFGKVDRGSQGLAKRDLPHVRKVKMPNQPGQKKSCMRDFVHRQFLPSFFKYI